MAGREILIMSVACICVSYYMSIGLCLSRPMVLNSKDSDLNSQEPRFLFLFVFVFLFLCLLCFYVIQVIYSIVQLRITRLYCMSCMPGPSSGLLKGQSQPT